MNTNDVRNSHVSPGIYSKEIDLTYQQNVIAGGTSLGLVGECVKGRAFQPTLVEDYTTFKKIFGGQNPELYQGTKYPRYELPYIAKSFLSQSNRLYVTRVLGKSGYKLPFDPFLLMYTESDPQIEGGNDVSTDIAHICPLKENLQMSFDNESSILSITDSDSNITNFLVGFEDSKSDFICKVLGTKPNETNNLVFVHKYAGLSKSHIGATGRIIINSKPCTDYTLPYQSASTPFFINENDEKLFRCISLSDGHSSNYDVKISIEKINKNNKTFDFVVRDYQTQDYTLYLEKYTNCSLDIDSIDFIGNKIGTCDGLYEQKSKYVTLDIIHNNLVYSSIPVGFEGYPFEFLAQECTPNLEYITENDKNVKPKYFTYGLDSFKSSNYFTKPIAKNVSVGYLRNFKLDEAVVQLNTTRFTVLLAGGFDGWDIFKTHRITNNPPKHANCNIVTRSSKTKSIENDAYDVVTDKTSDYNAFLEGIMSFDNPLKIDIDLFATPGLDFKNNSNLIDAAITMIEDKRKDCLYIATFPDKPMSVGDSEYEMTTPDSVSLEEFDSNYVATYYPWVKFFDTENSKYIFLPPTKDVVRNMAEIDKKSYPWFAPAGVNRGKINCIKPRKSLRLEEEDHIYNQRINPIRSNPNSAPIIWGQKTLQVANTMLNRINVRRLMIFIDKLIKKSTLELIFDQNEDVTVDNFSKIVTPILNNVRDNRGITDYRIQFDTSPETRSRLALGVAIFIKPIGALEYIELTYTLTNEGVSFDEIK